MGLFDQGSIAIAERGVCVSDKKVKTWTVCGGFLDWISWGFLLKLFARVMKSSGALDKLKEAAERTETKLDDAVVKALIAFIEAVD